MPSNDFLAVAFTDVNGNNKYNPGKDTLIGALVDTNNDHTVSVGDTVVLGTYPASIYESASGPGGAYTILESTVINVDLVQSNGISSSVQVETSLGTIWWFATPQYETFSTFVWNIVLESEIIDSISGAASDSVLAKSDAQGPGRPNNDVSVTGLQAGDQAFIDFAFSDWLV
jgi:hypothetical protein